VEPRGVLSSGNDSKISVAAKVETYHTHGEDVQTSAQIPVVCELANRNISVFRVEKREIKRHSVSLRYDCKRVDPVDHVHHFLATLTQTASKIMGRVYFPWIGANTDELLVGLTRNLHAESRIRDHGCKKRVEGLTMVIVANHPGGTSIFTDGPFGVELVGRDMMVERSAETVGIYGNLHRLSFLLYDQPNAGVMYQTLYSEGSIDDRAPWAHDWLRKINLGTIKRSLKL
jgi:hypothetical protein